MGCDPRLEGDARFLARGATDSLSPSRHAVCHRTPSTSKRANARVPRHEEDSRPALLSFSRACPDLLQQLPGAQVAALAHLELFPRGYRDKHLESASRRLREGFQPASKLQQQQHQQQEARVDRSKGGGAPLGPPMLQDLMRVMRDWHSAPESYIAESAPGELAASWWARTGNQEGLAVCI